jgi:NAD-dependent DNA ligase
MGRGTAEELAAQLGAQVQQSTREGTDYVVVGDLG